MKFGLARLNLNGIPSNIEMPNQNVSNVHRVEILVEETEKA